MVYTVRSPAGAFAWGVTICSLLSTGRAFVVGSRSRSASHPIPLPKHEVPANMGSPSAGGGLLARTLAIRGGAGNVRQVATQAELEDILSSSGNALVCVDFTATWCGPCQQIAPAFEALSQELSNVVFLKVDVDENEETAQQYDVFQMPTFLFIRKGEVVEQFSGANAAVLRQKIEGLLGDEGEESAAVTEGEAEEQAQEGAAEQAMDSDEGAAELKPDIDGACAEEGTDDDVADSGT